MDNNQSNDESGFLFNVDILVKSPSNALALQELLGMLNGNGHIADFRIKSGIELGRLIESMLQDKRKSLLSKEEPSRPSVLPSPIKEPELRTAAAGKGTKGQSPRNPVHGGSEIYDWIQVYIRDNRLIRLTANRGGQHIHMPCRILNFDEEHQMLNVYHVDEKQVYTFKLNEVDEVI
ncbi:hypothetical protein [Paenibacillus sp. XY044]|uniref:hypothetical protein n=1 Tax=Paenibacillus sp. XY044 TaxID=2026089 RepID=UPI000B988C55|nr:hypothetical protein [Paenibacillus sp. XY044]OZB96448.1 hypothetical protein CJP46_11190 [Paenibacillus sp. XY044]